MPRCRQLVTSLSPQLPGFEPRPIHVAFVVYKVALRQVSFQVVWFSSVSFISPMFHTHLHFQCYSTQNDKWEKPGKLPTEIMLFQNSRSIKTQKYFHFFRLQRANDYLEDSKCPNLRLKQNTEFINTAVRT